VRAPSIPVLRKGLPGGSYQVHEAPHGADVVLLIVARSDQNTADRTRERVNARLTALVEVHTRTKRRARGRRRQGSSGSCPRLRTLEVDRSTFERIAPGLPSGVVKIAESGVARPLDLIEYPRPAPTPCWSARPGHEREPRLRSPSS